MDFCVFVIARDAVSSEPEVRNAFWRERVAIVFTQKTRTLQAPRDACDAKAIVRRFQSTGVMEHLMKMEPKYGDFTNVGDYLESLTRVRDAQAGFDALPAEMRDECENDPAKFIEFVHDVKNVDKLHELGLGKLSDELHGPREVQEELDLGGKPIIDPKVEPEVSGGE